MADVREEITVCITDIFMFAEIMVDEYEKDSVDAKGLQYELEDNVARLKRILSENQDAIPTEVNAIVGKFLRVHESFAQKKFPLTSKSREDIEGYSSELLKIVNELDR